jgi:hypothetical protein
MSQYHDLALMTEGNEWFKNKDVSRRLADVVNAAIEDGSAADSIEAVEQIETALKSYFIYLFRIKREPGSYQRYLQTQHWQRMREMALDSAGHACQLCHSQDRLETHHRTYERIGNELPSDLTVLCHYCHAKFHDKLA